MNGSRLLYIDKLKALAMLMVIMGHTMYFCMYDETKSSDPILNIICTFHVPLFFFISGFVISSPPNPKKFVKKAYKFLMPMLLVGFINAILIGRIRDFFLNGGHNGYWYLLTLTLFYMLLMPFLLTKEKKGIWAFIIDSGLAVGIWAAFVVSMRWDNIAVAAINPWGAFAFWPFFIIGYISHKYGLADYITGKHGITILLITAYLTLLILSFDQIDCLPLFLDFTIALVAIAALMSLFYIFSNSMTFIDRQLLLIGNNTLDIYIYHYFFIYFINLKFLKDQHIVVELITTATLTIIIAYASMTIGKMVRKAINACKKLIFKVPLVLLFLIAVNVQADDYDEHNYLPPNCDVKIDETNLPIVFIDTSCGDENTNIIHRDWRILVRMKIINNPDGINYGDTIVHPDQTTDYEGWIAIKYRGNSSFTESPKKPYIFKTLATADIEGEKKRVKIMGMPKDNDWVLLSPYSDRSMIRNVLMFNLERPWLEYSPRARHCELILDGVYRGVYIMSERPRKGDNRLNLEDPGDSGDRLTGGYHLQIDRWIERKYNSKYPALDQYGNPYTTFNHIYFHYEHPSYEEMIPKHKVQLEYIQHQIDLMEDAIASDNYTDKETGYQKYIDVMSFIDYELAQEFASNIDGYRLSTHIYKRRDSVDPRFKLTIWDFDIALGNANYCDGERTDLWHYQNTWAKSADCYNKIPFWWVRLMDDPEYVKKLKERWAQYRNGNFSYERIIENIDSMTYLLNIKGACQRNYEAYPIWGKKIWPVPNYQTVNTYEKEIAYLKTWIGQRVAWMDLQLDNNTDVKPTIMPHGTIKKEIAYYCNLQGIRLAKPPENGIFIIRYKDGSSMKIVKSN